jgi:hypothetical protein
MRAWRCIHFSLVPYPRQFYNTSSAMQCCSCVRMLATYIESSESVRDSPAIGAALLHGQNLYAGWCGPAQFGRA